MQGDKLVLSRKIIVLTLLFSGLATANFFLISPDESEYISTEIITDFHLNGWQDVDIQNDEKVLKALETDSTIFKKYKYAEGSEVVLYVGHYRELQKARLSHSPKVCFTAQGWIMSNSTRGSLQFNGYKSNFTSMIVNKGTEKELVYYWYQFDDKTFADLYKMKFALLLKKIGSGKEDNLFIRVTAPVIANTDEASAVIEKFLKNLFPSLMTTFFTENRKILNDN